MPLERRATGTLVKSTLMYILRVASLRSDPARSRVCSNLAGWWVVDPPCLFLLAYSSRRFPEQVLRPEWSFTRVTPAPQKKIPNVRVSGVPPEWMLNAQMRRLKGRLARENFLIIIDAVYSRHVIPFHSPMLIRLHPILCVLSSDPSLGAVLVGAAGEDIGDVLLLASGVARGDLADVEEAEVL